MINFTGLFSVFMIFICFSQNAQSAEPIIIAHRGESIFNPENTLSSFRAANGKADMVEFDVRVSEDGELVLMHDEKLDRTTNSDGYISSMTLSMLKKLDAGSWYHPLFEGEKIPTLEEALLTITPFANSLVEHKAGTASQYLNLINRLGVKNSLILQSFDWEFLKEARRIDSDITLAALGSDELTSSIIQSIKDMGVGIIAWNKKSISKETCDLVHSYGLNLFVYTVDGTDIPVYTDMGLDGVITDDPALAKYLLKPGNSALSDLKKGQLAHWALDDGTRDGKAIKVKDSIGESHGTLFTENPENNWIFPPESPFPGAVRLNGKNEFILLPHNRILDINTNEMTISLWVKLNILPSELETDHYGIFDSVEDSYLVYAEKKQREIKFKVTDINNDSNRPGIPEEKLEKGKWHHIVGVYNGNAGRTAGQVAIFLDGKLQDIHTGKEYKDFPYCGMNGKVKPGQTAAIGRNGTWNYDYFKGCVADISLWNRALSYSEIQELCQR